MEIRRLTMLLDALTAFLISNYYGRGNNAYQDQKMLPSKAEVLEMVDFAIKQKSLTTQQKTKVSEIFLQFFDRAAARIKKGVPDSQEIARLKRDFEEAISCFFEANDISCK